MRRTFRTISAGKQISSRLLLEQFGSRDGLIIIDEYDRVEDAATYSRMAELIKHFSDAESRSKIILVGVADTLSQLTGQHESIARSLAEIKLDRMSDEELAEIITKGEEHLRTTFRESIKRRIIGLADGFPYFVHLISRHAARRAGDALLEKAQTPLVVADREYTDGLQDALDNAEHSLAEQYQNATVTTRRPSEKFVLVLWGMALADVREVQVQDIAKNVAYLTGTEAKAAGFSWTLGELASDRRTNILTQSASRSYKRRKSRNSSLK